MKTYYVICQAEVDPRDRKPVGVLEDRDAATQFLRDELQKLADAANERRRKEFEEGKPVGQEVKPVDFEHLFKTFKVMMP